MPHRLRPRIELRNNAAWFSITEFQPSHASAFETLPLNES
ncbi:hypothetical protein RISK_005009 [Rhodopirellula islandica]|uniref:Uncharacterized protein n=1 Tax=Rhodopirellula islandica TaxID=595434 RepID=A0A0J1EBW4_RHOIS|nr:hypothetical protein RISK_005009 [Rhodopirellula islandica]